MNSADAESHTADYPDIRMDKMKILVGGSTGNIGSLVIENFPDDGNELYAAVRDIVRARKKINRKSVDYIHFDLEKNIFPTTQFDSVFLIRPPHISRVDCFKRYIESLNKNTKVVFLSVAGADRKSYLPHAKIEKEIRRKKIDHCFIRPSYFMENLITTLWDELVDNRRIFLPSSNIKFNWISARDIAEVAIMALKGDLPAEEIQITNEVEYSFQEIVDKINAICMTNLTYSSPSLIKYLYYEFSNKTKLSYILVMLLLHYLPKYKKETLISTNFRKIFNKPPESIEDFIFRHKEKFSKLTQTLYSSKKIEL